MPPGLLALRLRSTPTLVPRFGVDPAVSPPMASSRVSNGGRPGSALSTISLSSFVELNDSPSLLATCGNVLVTQYEPANERVPLVLPIALPLPRMWVHASSPNVQFPSHTGSEMVPKLRIRRHHDLNHR